MDGCAYMERWIRFLSHDFDFPSQTMNIHPGSTPARRTAFCTACWLAGSGSRLAGARYAVDGWVNLLMNEWLN